MIPYGRQWIEDDDIQSVVNILKSDWLTTGPKVEEFEENFSKFTRSKYAIAVNSGTAALHCAMYAIDVKKGQQAVEVAKARKAWLEKTANSPAARAGVLAISPPNYLHHSSAFFVVLL